jgi:soluble lytic murein transglycosylase
MVLLSRTFSWLAVLGVAISPGCSDVVADEPPPSVLQGIAPMDAQDSTLRAATTALERGRPWEATRLLAPLLADSTRRTPAVVLRAAEAASGWEGWEQAMSLLASERWLSTQFNGYGHVVMARAALSLSPRSPRTDTLALQHARAAVAISTTRAEQGARVTLLARALDRLRQADSARAVYLRAAALLPEVHDWLVLRAARITEDDRMRQRDYASIKSPAAIERRDWTEADAREMARDYDGAATILERLGARAAAMRLRFLSSGDSAARAKVRQDLAAYIPTASPGEARAAVELLDSRGASRTAAEELAAARAAFAYGALPRAVAGFAVASAAGLSTDRDRFNYGDALLRLGRGQEAAAQFSLVKPPSSLAGMASYQRARALLRAGNGTAARTTLLATRRDFGSDSAAASSAAYLLGDLASDAGRDEEARREFLALARAYPSSAFAPQARLRAALIAAAGGNHGTAARELDTLVTRYGTHTEVLAALYWAGREWKAAGIDSAARSRWQAIIQRNPASYYSMLAARALRQPVWVPSPGDSSTKAFGDIDSAVTRARLLEQLGMDDEARYEDDRLFREAGNSLERMIATARAFARRGNASRAISLARRALDQGAAPTADVYRLLYPVMQEGVLRAESEGRRLDPALVAAVIRQESNFTPHATSVAGARGLMQVMPAVGASLARSLRYPLWDPVLLYQPDVNVQLGVRHLASAMTRYPHEAYALAAYNAGDSRVKRWSAKPGASDPELFVERIPYVETRDYVRIIQRNREFYRALYGWPARQQ